MHNSNVQTIKNIGNYELHISIAVQHNVKQKWAVTETKNQIFR